jgi:hypothetical protein
VVRDAALREIVGADALRAIVTPTGSCARRRRHCRAPAAPSRRGASAIPSEHLCLVLVLQFLVPLAPIWLSDMNASENKPLNAAETVLPGEVFEPPTFGLQNRYISRTMTTLCNTDCRKTLVFLPILSKHFESWATMINPPNRCPLAAQKAGTAWQLYFRARGPFSVPRPV